MDDLETERRQTTLVRPIEEPRTSAAAAPALVVIQGADIGHTYDLVKPVTMIGRSSQCDIQIDEESASRSHAIVIGSAQGYILRDLDSTNGTHVNDALMHEHRLADGDRIKIGSVVLKFLSGSDVEHAFHDEVYRRSTVDATTQVFNKRYLLEALEREVSRARRHGRPLSLILLDLDRFKSINDELGHPAGDYLLRALCDVLRAELRNEDLLARYGGDEFVLVLAETDAEGARAIAEKLRALIAQSRFRYEGRDVSVTISLGVATLDAGIADAEAFVKAADARLYQAKSGGRDRVGA